MPEDPNDPSHEPPDGDVTDEGFADEDGEVDPSDPSVERPLPMRNRIAQTFRDQLTVETRAEIFGNLREAAFPLAALAAMLVLVITFRAVLLPFILACALVYLMEPVVRRICGRGVRGKALPRWVAVILVYLSFIVVTTVSAIFIVPTFVTEIVRFADEIPEYVQDFRNEQLPGINREVQDFLRSYLPVKASSPPNGLLAAQSGVSAARRQGVVLATAHGNAMSRVHHAAEVEIIWRMEMIEGHSVGSYIVRTPDVPAASMSVEEAMESPGWVYARNENESAVVITPDRDGAMRVQLNEVALEVEQVDDGAWVLRQKRRDNLPVREEPAVEVEQMFDLERRLDEVIEGLVSTSNERIASLIDFGQKLVVGILAVFVGLVLTLMVAAFMSIDLPRVMAFIRSLVPRRGRDGYDILLKQLDRGLSGVVRGQLLICLVNGVLTWIGLAVMGVKFSVLLAVIAGVMSLIPVFGTILSTIPIVLIALTGGFMKGVGALVWILVIHAIEANLLNPKIIGSSAHIHPVIVIFALLAGESAYGLVGALLAVPTASILLTLFNFVRTKAWRQAEIREPSA